MTPEEVVSAFEQVRRAPTVHGYAPHKPFLLLIALGRVQRGENPLMTLADVRPALQQMLSDFARPSAAHTAHLPFWRLGRDADGRLWELKGLASQRGEPTLAQLNEPSVAAGFTPEVEQALRSTPGLPALAAQRLLDSFFPRSLHEDIAAEAGVDLDTNASQENDPQQQARARTPAFRSRVLQAYEYRCCVCGFGLLLGRAHAGLEAAHIKWHTYGGPDVEPNGLSLCALHHKLFDMGAFAIDPNGFRVVLSRSAVSIGHDFTKELDLHGREMRRPQDPAHMPSPQFIDWNWHNVFKAPPRVLA